MNNLGRQPLRVFLERKTSPRGGITYPQVHTSARVTIFTPYVFQILLFSYDAIISSIMHSRTSSRCPPLRNVGLGPWFIVLEVKLLA